MLTKTGAVNKSITILSLTITAQPKAQLLSGLLRIFTSPGFSDQNIPKSDLFLLKRRLEVELLSFNAFETRYFM